MIIDSLGNARTYRALHPGFAPAFDFVRDYLKQPLPEGRYDIDGDSVYAMVQIYDTLDERTLKLEAHKDYIDIQVVVSGRESLGWADAAGLTPEAPYDAEKDVTLFTQRPATFAALTDRQFMVFFPHDAHLPKGAVGEPSRVVKIVVKVKM